LEEMDRRSILIIRQASEIELILSQSRVFFRVPFAIKSCGNNRVRKNGKLKIAPNMDYMSQPVAPKSAPKG
ncbi:MAG: hypothetical protein ACYS9T_11215, partial [Planctomycetota bacterium]